MSKKKKKKKTCKLPCIFFQENPEIISEKIEDGIKQRKVKRHCLYDNSLIDNWDKICPRGQNCPPKS